MSSSTSVRILVFKGRQENQVMQHQGKTQEELEDQLLHQCMDHHRRAVDLAASPPSIHNLRRRTIIVHSKTFCLHLDLTALLTNNFLKHRATFLKILLKRRVYMDLIVKSTYNRILLAFSSIESLDSQIQ